MNKGLERFLIVCISGIVSLTLLLMIVVISSLGGIRLTDYKFNVIYHGSVYNNQELDADEYLLTATGLSTALGIALYISIFGWLLPWVKSLLSSYVNRHNERRERINGPRKK